MIEDKPAIVVSSAATVCQDAIDAELKWAQENKSASEWRFAILARRLAEFEDHQHFRELGYASIRVFLEAKTKQYDLKLRSLYGCLSVGKKLAPFLTDKQMKLIGKSKLYQIAQYTEKGGGAPPKDIVEKALDKSLTFSEFESYCKSKRPLLDGENPDDFDLVKVEAFWLQKKDRDFANEVFKLARRVGEYNSRNAIFCDILQAGHNHFLELQREQEEEQTAS